jgi:tRNA(Ile)-lysidine synthase
LGGITPVSGNVIRPMLKITRAEVETFLEEWCLSHIEDSSNRSDAFLRNRIRHQIMPLLRQENPKLAENLSQMALRLREDEEVLSSQAEFEVLPSVESLKTMPRALRSRMLDRFLKASGVKEPEDSHIRLAEALVFAENPSARASFPGGVVITRNYGRLEALNQEALPARIALPCPGEAELPGLTVTCGPAQDIINTEDCFTVHPAGELFLRPRITGDTIRLPGGSKSLKKLFIDRKIPASRRNAIPVLCDEEGILGVYQIGVNQNRAASQLPAVTVRFQIKK